MPDKPTLPEPTSDQGQARFRADLAAYLDSLPVGELAELLGELPSCRQQPAGLGVLMVALNERLPDAYKLLPPAGHPGPGEGRRRSLRQVVADRRAARTSRHASPLPTGLAEWLADRQRQVDLQAERARAGAVAERRVAETLRTRATDPTRRPAARSPTTHRPSGRAIRNAAGRTRSATASPRTASATAGGFIGSAPSTSARPTAGRCPSRRHAPSLGCRWAATTTRSATATVRTADPARTSGKPRPGAGACCPGE